MKSSKKIKRASFIALTSTSCFILSCKKSNVSFKAIAADAIVINEGNPLADGCGWLIKINGTDSLYSPSNLAEVYKIDSLKVNVTYTILNSKFNCGMLPGHGYTQIKLGAIAKQ